MSAVEVDSLNPDTVRLTSHVVDRYMERRGWRDPALRSEAEASIRALLWRVAAQCPPITCRPAHQPARIFKGGELVWVVSADFSAVVTFWKRGRK